MIISNLYKKILSKKKSWLREKTTTSKQVSGFTLLVAILIIFLVLSVGISVSLIARKELDIAFSLRESNSAYYASESGVECARYWSTENTSYFAYKSEFDSFPFDSPFRKIRCNGQDIPLTHTTETRDGVNVTVYEFDFDAPTEKATVKVVRWPGPEIKLEITSRGYNTPVDDDPKRVQKFKSVEIVGADPTSGQGVPMDIMIAMDISASMSGARSDEPPLSCDDPSSTELDCAISAVKTFTSNLLVPNGQTQIGLVAFSKGLRCKGVTPFVDDECLDERLDVPLTPNNIYFNSFFYSKINLKDMIGDTSQYDQYRGAYGYGSNYHAATVFAGAELNGETLDPKTYKCYPPGQPVELNSFFPTFISLGGQNRDRPDGEYPDAIIIIGDFLVNAYHKDNWCLGTNDTNSRIAFASALQRIAEQQVKIYLVLVGSDTLPNSLVEEIENVNVPYSLYTTQNYSNLLDTLTEVQGDLIDLSVTPIVDK